MRFNIVGNPDDIKKILDKWPATEVLQRFGKGDINIDIHEDYADDLYDIGGDLNIKVVFLGD